MVRDDPNDRTVIERVDPLVGSVFDGKYRIEFRLASGGFGAIYRARDVVSNRELAIKVVHARLARDPEVVARFRREGETLTSLRSPHTITAYEVGETPEGTLYIALELMRGVSLYERLRTHGPLPWPRMITIARGVCDSLAEAHSLGIVHRDLKPTNIHLERVGDNEDFVKVLDFGIAKILESSHLDNQDLTHAGLMIGTLDYMSPEQMLGGEITGGTDLYTLGIVMYEMVTGRRPFSEAPTAAAALAASLKPPAPMASLAVVPAELDLIVMRCLERDSNDRYRNAAELGRALERVAGMPGELTETTAIIRPSVSDLETSLRPPPGEFDPDATKMTPLPRKRSAPPVAPPTVAGFFQRTSSTTPPAPGGFVPRTSSPTPPVPAGFVPGPPAAPLPPPWPPPGAAARPRGPTPPPPFETEAPTIARSLYAAQQVTPPPTDTLRGVAVPQQRTPTGLDLPVADRSSVRGYEVDRVVARDALVRRAVWVIGLVVAAIIVIAVAARL